MVIWQSMVAVSWGDSRGNLSCWRALKSCSLTSLCSVDSVANFSCRCVLICCNLVSLASVDSMANLSCRCELTCCSLAYLCSDISMANLSHWCTLISCSLDSLSCADSASSQSCLHCKDSCLCSTIWEAHLARSRNLRLLSHSSFSADSDWWWALSCYGFLWSLRSLWVIAGSVFMMLGI